MEIIDTMYLNVSDTAGNMAAMQPFAITIRARDNSAPSITVQEDLVVSLLYINSISEVNLLGTE
jgi:hypothetical protein